jgi:hypothetical protein
MPHSKDETNELPLINRKGVVSWRHQTAEERNRVRLLNEYCPEVVCGCITVHDEGLGKVREYQHRGQRHCCFESTEGNRGVIVPCEPLLF